MHARYYQAKGESVCCITNFLAFFELGLELFVAIFTAEISQERYTHSRLCSVGTCSIVCVMGVHCPESVWSSTSSRWITGLVFCSGWSLLTLVKFKRQLHRHSLVALDCYLTQGLLSFVQTSVVKKLSRDYRSVRGGYWAKGVWKCQWVRVFDRVLSKAFCRLNLKLWMTHFVSLFLKH